MKIRIRTLSILLLICSCCALIAWAATDWTNDSANKGAFLMEDTGNESDRSKQVSNDLTETGGTIARSTDRKFGSYSRDFERGDTEYLTHGDSLDTDISGANQSLTLTAWYKPESDDAYNESVVGKMDTGGSQEQYLMFRADSASNVMRCYISANGSTLVYAEGATGVSSGSWTHVACVHDADDDEIRVYINGSLDSNGANNPKSHTGGIFDSTAPFTIGVNFSSGSPDGNNYADGLIDDVGVFDRALSQSEISDIYNNGLLQVVSGGSGVYTFDGKVEIDGKMEID